MWVLWSCRCVARPAERVVTWPGRFVWLGCRLLGEELECSKFPKKTERGPREDGVWREGEVSGRRWGWPPPAPCETQAPW